MSVWKTWWAGLPLALLAAGCIIVPADPSLVTVGTRGPSPGPWSPSADPYGDPYARSGADPYSPSPAESSRPTRSGSSGEATVPVIASLTASPTNLTFPGQEVVFHIEAVDASGTPAYTWSATGGTLTSTAGTRVAWRSPAQPGRYTVLVLVTSPSGGATTGAVNIEVRRDGTAEVLAPAAPAAPGPAAAGTASAPAPTADPTPGTAATRAPASEPSPAPAAFPTPAPVASACDTRDVHRE